MKRSLATKITAVLWVLAGGWLLIIEVGFLLGTMPFAMQGYYYKDGFSFGVILLVFLFVFFLLILPGSIFLIGTGVISIRRGLQLTRLELTSRETFFLFVVPFFLLISFPLMFILPGGGFFFFILAGSIELITAFILRQKIKNVDVF